MADEKSKFIFFESWDNYLDTLEEDRDINYVNAVARAMIKYGLYDDCMTDDKSIERKVHAVCSELMKNTKARYAASVGNGRQGGRPQQYDPNEIKNLRAQGMSYSAICKQLGCSIKTVQRALGAESIEDDDEI